MRPLKSLRVLLRRLRPGKRANEPEAYRVVRFKLPLELEPVLQAIRERELAYLHERGVPVPSMSDSAVIASCIWAVKRMHELTEAADPDEGPRLH